MHVQRESAAAGHFGFAQCKLPPGQPARRQRSGCASNAQSAVARTQASNNAEARNAGVSPAGPVASRRRRAPVAMHVRLALRPRAINAPRGVARRCIDSARPPDCGHRAR